MRFLIFAIFFASIAFAGPSSNRTVTAQFLKNGSSVLTVPASGNDVLLGRATTDTVTGKTMDGGSNTFTGITNSAIGSSAAIDFSKLATLTSGNIIVGSAGNVPTSVAMSGAITIAASGATSYSGVVPLAAGGTNNGSLAATAGGVLYTDGTKVVNVGAGTGGQFLKSNTASPPTWANNSATPWTQTRLTAMGSTVGYVFVQSGGTVAATAGATYTNNGHTYTVITTVSGGDPFTSTYIWTTGASAPQADAACPCTLTKSGGGGDATIVFDTSQTLATYTVPASVAGIRVMALGAGGGAGGANSAASNAAAGGGGAGGGWSSKIMTVTPGTVYYYSLGAAGTGGAAAGNGVNGKATLFDSVLEIVGCGGSRGIAGADGTVAAVGASPGGFGCATPGNNGDIMRDPTAGSYGLVFSGTTSALGGAGGGSPFGAGAVSNISSANGSAGTGYGSGGSGGAQHNNGGTKTGGNGTAGLIIIDELY